MATLFSLLAKNNHKVILSPSEEKVTEALAASGFLAGMMMTLATPLGDGAHKGYHDESWFRAAVGLLMRDYYTQYGVMLQYQVVMNHGWAGKGKLSGHIIWKNELPEHTAFLVNLWNSKYGVDRAVMSPHSQGLRYYVKNMSQPNALTHDGPHNRTAVPTKKRARHAGRG
jgi:hypothetical protein